MAKSIHLDGSVYEIDGAVLKREMREAHTRGYDDSRAERSCVVYSDLNVDHAYCRGWFTADEPGVRVWPPVDWPGDHLSWEPFAEPVVYDDDEDGDGDGYQNEDLDEARAELTAWGL
jgi:hypothetical protein